VEPLPSFLFEKIDMYDKIKKFNRYIYNIAKNRDLIIISIPGGIMQKNPYIFEEFGEMAFLISNSIRADICILSTYAQEINDNIIEQFIKLCKYKYNFPTKYINISNVACNVSIEDKKEKYIEIPSSMIDFMISDKKFDDVTVFNSLNPEQMNNVCKFILNELQENL
jgi:peptide maturation system protein (TIGR04066 family)